MNLRRSCLGLFLIVAGTLAAVPSFAEVRGALRPESSEAAGSFGQRDSRLGVSLPNLGSPLTGPIFKDAMKQASPWSSASALRLDASGNILSLTRGQIADTTIFASATYPSGDYTLLYDGTGTIEVGGATTLEVGPGRAVLRLAARSGGIHVRLTATASADPVRNIRLVLPGYETTYASQPFLPSALDALRQFQVLRFEQWSQAARETSVESWPARATESDFTQAGDGGVAPEYMIALANATGDDPWFVLPVDVTDAYVEHLAQLVRATLAPNLRPIFQFAEDPLAAGSATSAYATVAGLAERRSSNPRTAAVLWYAARSIDVLDTIALASAGGPVRPVRVLGLPSGATPGGFEARAAQTTLAAGAGHADAVALGAALAQSNLFPSIAAAATRDRVAVLGSNFQLQPTQLQGSAGAETLYSAALEQWHDGGGALAIVPSDASSALWAGAREYMMRHPCAHSAATAEEAAPAAYAASATPTLTASGKIYVANSSPKSNIVVYPGNPKGSLNESPIATIAGADTGLDSPSGIGFDATGNIYVSNDIGGGPNNYGAVTVYPPNPKGTLDESPIATIAGSNTGLSNPFGIALDGSGKIYVANAGDRSITVYAANPRGTLDEAPIATITGSNTGFLLPDGVAIDGSGKIYVIDGDTSSISVFAANPSGTLDESPIATIAGANTGLGYPAGIALDANGKIYVSNLLYSSITVYGANPSGTLNESPIATIAGSNTGLTGLYQIALDAKGRIYVLNTYSIDVFAANPHGTLNEAPIATIAGSKTKLTFPAGIAIQTPPPTARFRP